MGPRISGWQSAEHRVTSGRWNLQAQNFRPVVRTMDMPITEHPTRMPTSQSVGCGAVGVAVDHDVCKRRVQQFASGKSSTSAYSNPRGLLCFAACADVSSNVLPFRQSSDRTSRCHASERTMLRKTW